MPHFNRALVPNPTDLIMTRDFEERSRAGIADNPLVADDDSSSDE